MTADEFMKIHRVERRVSKIEPYMDEILKLRRNGVSYNGVLKFLALNGVEVTMATLSVYMRKHAPPELVPPPKTQPAKREPESPRQQPPQEPRKAKSKEPDGGSPTPAPRLSEKFRKPEVDLRLIDEE